LYLWLSYRFLGIFKDREQATYAKSLTEQRINDTLTKFSHSAELKERMRLLKKRQIKESKMISELDAEDGTLPVLSTEDLSTEDLPTALELSSLKVSNLNVEDSSMEPSSLKAISSSTEDTLVEPSSLDLSSMDAAPASGIPETRGVV